MQFFALSSVCSQEINSLFALSFRQVGPRRHLLKQRLCQAGRQVRHADVGARDRRGADAGDQIRPRHGDLLLNEQVLLIDKMQWQDIDLDLTSAY